MSEICRSWLLFTTGSLSPLSKLAERDLLNNEVLSAAVCLMMWSIASIQIAAKNQKSAVDPNTFLVGFLYAATALDSFCNCPVTLKELEEALGFYRAVLKVHELNDVKVRQLYQEIKVDVKAKEKAEDTEQEHPSEVVDPNLVLPRIKTDSEEVGSQANAETAKYESMLEPIVEESTTLSMSTSAIVRSSEPKPKEITALERPKLFGTSHKTVRFATPSPEVETTSAWQTNSVSIVPSLKKRFV